MCHFSVQNHKGLSSVQAVCAFLRFVPLEGETSGFFTSVATSIIKLLRSKQCMPVVNYSNQQIGQSICRRLYTTIHCVNCLHFIVRIIIVTRAVVRCIHLVILITFLIILFCDFSMPCHISNLYLSNTDRI